MQVFFLYNGFLFLKRLCSGYSFYLIFLLLLKTIFYLELLLFLAYFLYGEKHIFFPSDLII